MLAGSTIVQRGLPVFITGSVMHGAVVDCDDDVCVQGDVVQAQVTSLRQSVTVIGSVTGTPSARVDFRRDKTLRAARLSTARLPQAPISACWRAAWQCSLRAKGNVYLPCTMSESLSDVELHVDGGVLPILEPEIARVAGQPERRHARVGGRLRAAMALHSLADLQFRPCTVLDLSTGGARCALSGKDLDPGLGSIVADQVDVAGLSGPDVHYRQSFSKNRPGPCRHNVPADDPARPKPAHRLLPAARLEAAEPPARQQSAAWQVACRVRRGQMRLSFPGFLVQSRFAPTRAA